MKTIYTASLDNLTKTISGFAILLFIWLTILPQIISNNTPSLNSNKNLISLGVGIFVLIVFGFVYMYRILRYELSDTELIIVRPYKSVHIPLNTISGIIKLEKTDLLGTIRTFGNGGFFGYTGYYWKKSLGTMIFYLTQRKNLILIETIAKTGKAKGGKIVISPDDISMEGKLIELLKGMKR
jgi:hypothetical protein